jgi:hypothetical protein
MSADDDRPRAEDPAAAAAPRARRRYVISTVAGLALAGGVGCKNPFVAETPTAPDVVTLPQMPTNFPPPVVPSPVYYPPPPRPTMNPPMYPMPTPNLPPPPMPVPPPVPMPPPPGVRR